MTATELLHYEDFHEGQVLPFGTYHLTKDEVIGYAREFDPQPFHLDEEAARQSVLKGLSASGWQSSAILVRLAVDAYANRSAALGSKGFDEAKWLKPVYAGETLTGRVTVLSKRRSASKPGVGVMKCLFELLNTAGEKKIEMTGVQFMKLRQP
jgi:acyl dehydratase